MTSDARVILYFVTEDWYFCSHRLQLAVRAKNEGHSVFVVTRVESHGSEIEAAGLTLFPIKLSRRSKNPFVELMTVLRLIRILRRVRPDIIHNVALKPVLYGSFAARLCGNTAIVNAMAGLGFMFTSASPLARMLRPVIAKLLKIVLSGPRTITILQNPDDARVLCENEVVDPKRVRLIRGSGVDTSIYAYKPQLDGTPVVLLASRMLWDKGVGEFVEAAGILKKEGVTARFVLAGESDQENPGSISSEQLREWDRDGDIEWWGKCNEMPKIFNQVHIVCLPTTYGEGVPKVLIEAASCGRPIVATDAPGCREIVVDGENGLLVPAKNMDALVDAIRGLLESSALRERMGLAGRERVKREFSIEKVAADTLNVYELIGR